MQKPRADLYGPIHMAVRRLLYETAMGLGTTDFRSDAEAERTLGNFVNTLSLLTEHAEAEDRHFHPVLREAAGSVVDEFEATHQALEHEQDEMASLAAQIRQASGMARLPLAAELYSRFNRYVATQLQHMAKEEADLPPLLWAHFTDEQLEAIRGAVMAESTPERSAEWMGWMLPAMSQVQLVGMLGAMRGNLPAPAFEGLVQRASALLGDRWAGIASELQLDA